jgi:hypothetical protein
MPRVVAELFRSGFGWLVLSFVPACTLTSAPFEPEPVAAGPTIAGAGGGASNEPPPVDDGAEASAGAGGSASACSSTELAGCGSVPLAPMPECRADDDCGSRVCDAGACAAANCFDGRRNAGEEGIDCGGPCSAPCRQCQVAGDCASLVCRAGGCAEASCDDGIVNQGESDVDCAGPCSERCDPGDACTGDGDCASGRCGPSSTCIEPSCSDGVRNQDEPAIDCGGPCPPCSLPPTCDDAVRNGDELQIDCGGTCAACPGVPCTADAACASGACEEGRCCGGTLGDCTRCARRLATGIDCTSDGPEPSNDCDAFLQCLSDNPEACASRSAPECSGNPLGACDHLSYGGNDGAGILLADAILRAAQCSL